MQSMLSTKKYIEDVGAPSIQSMWENWEGKKEPNIHDLKFHMSSLLMLQGHAITSKKSNSSSTKPKTQQEKPLYSHN